MVHLDSRGAVEDRWCTLVNPGRDLGAQHIHGIRTADVLDAPTFDEIAGRLARLLRGRSPVAHNLRFDLAFLRAEFGRLGVTVPLDVDLGLCTMRLAGRFLPSAGRSLAACCKAAGIRLTNAHSALHDAHAAAELLAYYLRRAGQPPPWASVCAEAARVPWPDLPLRRVAPVPRRAAAGREEHFLQRLVARLPRVDGEHADAYLDLLDRALVDRHISVSEARGLAEFAREVGLGREQVVELHERYLEALAAAALEDGIVTDAERADLVQVTALLGLEEAHLDRALKRAADGERPVRRGLGEFRLAPGDEVVFTGQLDAPRHVWEKRAIDAGLRPADSVTRRTKILVAADSDSQSGKARRARQIGVPIVDAETFLRLCRQVRTDGVNVS